MSIVKHLDREVQYYLHIDMQTGDKPIDIRQNLERARQELKKYKAKLRIAGKNI
jgi:GTPase involved in cell partitioning and DNA repair